MKPNKETKSRNPVKSLSARLTLRELVDVLGDVDAGSTVYIVNGTMNRTDREPMPRSDALRVYGDRKVVKVRPNIYQDGEYTGNIYFLAPDETKGPEFIKNPLPRPYNLPTWRLGDDAWLARQDGTPIEVRITGASITDAVLLTLVTDNGSVIHDVPADALFPDEATLLAYMDGDLKEFRIPFVAHGDYVVAAANAKAATDAALLLNGRITWGPPVIDYDR